MIHIFKTLTIILLHNLFCFWKDNKNTLNNAETTKNDRTIIIMINEALPAIPIIVYKQNSSFFQTILKECGIVHCAFWVSFLSNIGRKELMTCHTKIHVFPSRRSENCTCLHLLHANVMLKTRGVEGLLPKLRAFLTNLHVHYINNLSAKYTVYEYTLYLCVLILHLKLCLFCIETKDKNYLWAVFGWHLPKAALYSALDFVNSHD